MPDRRLKREEQRIAKEIEEREQEEARKLLEQAQKKGARKLNIAEGAHLDKVTLMNQVTLRHESHALVNLLHHGGGFAIWGGQDSHNPVYLQRSRCIQV